MAFLPFNSMEYSHEKTRVAARKTGFMENMVIPMVNRKKIRFTAGWHPAKVLPSPSPSLNIFNIASSVQGESPDNIFAALYLAVCRVIAHKLSVHCVNPAAAFSAVAVFKVTYGFD